MEPTEKSYQRQAAAETLEALPSRFTHPESIDNWRHTRMLDLTKAIWEAFPGSRWMTIGDGRYGSDAAYLHAHGVDVIATSLTDERLQYAQEHGLIPAYRTENAERISMPDNACDFVLCKESYHHLPRPPIALYEMLRVSRVAVVLIEPMDDPKLLDGLKRALKMLIRGVGEQAFEPSGNFLYRLNLRELEKLMTAAGGEVLAFKGINDFYHDRFAQCAANEFNLGAMATRFGIWVQNMLTRVRLLGIGLGCAVLFKGSISPEVRRALKTAGFQIIDLPRNPYLGT
jgi:ubiquinone/menaquinone biosynthesis C-methylase UbiE